jgi:HAD superfamily hydrolase (TIGR01662 family)
MALTSITTIFFDLGYTLINFEGDVPSMLRKSYKALVQALVHNGYVLDTSEFIRQYEKIINAYYVVRDIDLIEKPVGEFVNKTLSLLGLSQASQKILDEAVAAMFKVTETCWHTEPDTHATLTRLRADGYQLGVISNASDLPDLNRLIKNASLRKYFSSIVVSAEEKVRKPDPRIFQKALEMMSVKPENSIMVGDTLTADILGAQKSGLRTVWITRRANRPENARVQSLVVPDWKIATLSELIPLLESQRT